jgi:hypothetical protein
LLTFDRRSLFRLGKDSMGISRSRKSLAGRLLALPFVLIACSSSNESRTASDNAEAIAASTVTLMYEGTCDFLHTCSTWSRKLPANEVMWGCGGAAVCSDSETWIAAPSRSYCGKTVTLCARGQCTTAVVRDVSDAHGWEGGDAVMQALGLSYGIKGHCSGYGGGKVTVTMGGSAAPPPPSAPVCGIDGHTCQGPDDCCSQICNDQNTCDPKPTAPSDTGGQCSGDGQPCAPDGSNSACCTGVCTSGACGNASTCSEGWLYCGGHDVPGDPNTLYRCQNQQLVFVQACDAGCTASDTEDDACVNQTSPQPTGGQPDCSGFDDGLWCGAAIGGDADTLYQCTDGQASVQELCQNGCEPGSVADSCY